LLQRTLIFGGCITIAAIRHAFRKNAGNELVKTNPLL
jgi:hypothetical protein